MRSVSDSVPKNLLPLAGKPFAVHQLELLVKNGIDHIVYSIGHYGDQIREVLGNGSKWKAHIDYVDEGPELRGTGGAVRLAYDTGVLEDTFFVLYGDSYLPIDYRAPWDVFAKRNELALMTVFRNEGRFDTSNARFENGKVFYDKKAGLAGKGGFEFIDYGLSIFRKPAIERIPTGTKYDLADLAHALSLENQLAGFEVTERFYEIGSPSGLKELEALL